MASSGSFSGSIRDGHYAVRVDWTQTKNVSENTSTITCRIYLVNDWSLSISSRNNNTMTIDGKGQNFTSPSISSTGTHLLGTVSQKVTHGSDGGKTISMSAVFKIQATLSGTFYDSITANTTVTLDSIPRASSVTASNAELGKASVIQISRASSSFTHTLTYAFGSATGTIVSKTASTSVTWNPPLSLANQIPKAVTGTCTITCTTYNGSTNIGSVTYDDGSGLDFDKAKQFLCQKCLDKVCEMYKEEMEWSDGNGRLPEVFIVDFATNELYAIGNHRVGFWIRDFWIRVDHKENEEEIMAIYAPEGKME